MCIEIDLLGHVPLWDQLLWLPKYCQSKQFKQFNQPVKFDIVTVINSQVMLLEQMLILTRQSVSQFIKKQPHWNLMHQTMLSNINLLKTNPIQHQHLLCYKLSSQINPNILTSQFKKQIRNYLLLFNNINFYRNCTIHIYSYMLGKKTITAPIFGLT